MTLAEIKHLVAEERHQYSQKVQEFIEDGFFERDDLVCCILSAKSIKKTEKDELEQAVDGMKHTILGRDTYGRPFSTVGKVIKGKSGRFYFYITAHQADE